MKKLLIVVDYQNDFVTGSLGFEGARSIASALRQKIESYRSAGQDVVYTLDTHGEGYLQTQEEKGFQYPIVSKAVKVGSFPVRSQVYYKAVPLFARGPLAAWSWQNGWRAKLMTK